MGANSLLKTVTRQRRGCDLNPGPTAPESSTLTTRLLSRLTLHCTQLFIVAKGKKKQVATVLVIRGCIAAAPF